MFQPTRPSSINASIVILFHCIMVQFPDSLSLHLAPLCSIPVVMDGINTAKTQDNLGMPAVSFLFGIDMGFALFSFCIDTGVQYKAWIWLLQVQINIQHPIYIDKRLLEV